MILKKMEKKKPNKDTPKLQPEQVKNLEADKLEKLKKLSGSNTINK